MNIWDGNACGNTFRIVQTDAAQGAAYAQQLRDQDTWEFDSLLLLTPSTRASVRMHVLEADGSVSDMCGNGCRAVAAVLDELGLDRTIDTGTDVLTVEHVPGGYRVHMGAVELMDTYDLRVGGTCLRTLVYSSAGEPHHVVVVDNVAQAPINLWGSYTTPEANCTVAAQVSPGVIHAATYERGVNRVTESCGTGACAAAHAIRRAHPRSTCFTVRMHAHELIVGMQASSTTLQGMARIRRWSPNPRC